MTLDPNIIAALIATASAWAWDIVGKPLVDKVGKQGNEALSEWAELAKWRKAAEEYATAMYEHHSTIRVFGKSEPALLDDTFTEVYILDEITGRLRLDSFDIKSLNQQFERHEQYLHRFRQQRISGLELVKKGANLFILGKPGAGKTTFLRYVTLQTLKGQIGSTSTPIFISLKEWSDSRYTDLIPFIAEQFAICRFPDAQPFIERLLHDGKAIVLFDGLDEANQEPEHQQNLVQLMSNFTRRFSSCQHLITCRIAASDFVFPGFQDVEMADFSRDQIHIYARKWFGPDEEAYKTFIGALYEDGQEGIRELCNIPLLLSMVCLAYSETGRFPVRRADLYRDALDALLKKWDASRYIRRADIYRGLSSTRKQQMFAQIAAETYEKSEQYFSQQRLESYIVNFLSPMASTTNEIIASVDIDGESVLKAIESQHGIFVERARNIYSFSHRTVQEYFTARYIVENRDRGTIKALVRHHLTDLRWREVFLITASLLDDANDIMTELCHAIDEMVINDVHLLRLLRWVNRKAKSANVPDELHWQKSGIRLAYLYLARAFASASDLALGLAREFTQGHFPDFDRFLASNLAVTLAQESILARDYARYIALNRATNLDFDRAFLLDYHLYHAWMIAVVFAILDNTARFYEQTAKYGQIFSNLVLVARDANMPQVVVRLTTMTPLPGDADGKVWETFANELLTIMQEERDIGRKWHLNSEPNKKLTLYFAANEMLLRCLDVALVDNQVQLLERLATPPEINS